MGKICIIGFHDLYLMQFLYKYTNILDTNCVEYDVYYWERESKSVKVESFEGIKKPFHYETGYYGTKISKLKGYIKYINYVRKELRKSNYERIILLTSQTALSLYLFIPRVNGKMKYIYDYRDLTFERNFFCKKFIQFIIRNSNFTAISSLGFKEVIGDIDKLLISHNVNQLKYIASEKELGKRIRIVYWGMVRQVEFNKKVIEFFGNDNRFELVYHGDGHIKELYDFSKTKGFSNVQFTGRYSTSQIADFVKNTDILLNLYDNDYTQRRATTVKLYDGFRYGLPMLIAKESYMERFMKINEYVHAVDLLCDSTNTIFEWYTKLPIKENPYEREIIQINDDDKVFERRLIEFVGVE